MASVVDGVLSWIFLACLVLVGLVYLTKWRLQVKDLFTGSHEAESFTRGETLREVQLTERDRELIRNGWHPADVFAARRAGLDMPEFPPYP